MSIRLPKHRPPTHPGTLLREEFLRPMEISQTQLATALGVPYQRVNEIVNQRRGITTSTALRLGKFFNMSAQFWLNAQLSWELYHAQESEADALARITPYASTPELV